MSLRLKRGSRIGVWSTNNVEWLLMQMASARIGAILVNTNPAYRNTQLSFALPLISIRLRRRFYCNIYSFQSNEERFSCLRRN